jgi:tetratricopeptide (TPR) repeat protein
MRRLPLAALLLAACATARRPQTAPAPGAELAPEITYPPAEVKVTPLDLELSGKNDEELFAIGTAAFEAKDFRRAATAFARLADLHPGSRHEAAALYDAGLAYERLEEWRLAMERFRALATRWEGPDAVDAAFRVAECQYHLRDLEDARATLDALARREDLPPAEHVRALAQRGIVELEAGRPEQAEKSLRLAISAWQSANERERLDDHDVAQAQFYLGEVYRGWFQAIRLDPSAGDEARLARELEDKAEMLLSAQGHYLRVIKIGNAEWAVAAGARIGELYDALHGELTGAPLPPGLDAEHAEVYRAELRRKVRVLVTKAISVYERTLAAAERTGVENRFVEQAHAALERMKSALLEGAEPASPASAPDQAAAVSP